MNLETPVNETSRLIDVQCQPVKLMNDCVIMTLGDGNAEIDKRISYEDFLAIVRSAVGRKNDEQLNGFSMPSNCFYFASSASTIQLSCYYQERTAILKYRTLKFPIKVPNMIISHVLERQGSSGRAWRVTASKYFCTDSAVSRLPRTFINSIDHTNRIYLSAFTNTYEDGKMCYGGNSMPSVMSDNNLRGLQWYYEFLFDSEFNDDLGVKATGMSPSEWYQLLKEAAAKDEPFPYSKLRNYVAPTA
jgi:hypothetical protein